MRRLDHELKSPLTAMRVVLANLAGEPLNDCQQELICSIQYQALRLSSLSTTLRKLAEHKGGSLTRSSLALARLLDEGVVVAQGHALAAAETRRPMVVLPRAPWPVPDIAGDLLFLARDNVLKFTRPGDTIELRAFADGSAVAIEVADSGPGFSAKETRNVGEEL